MARRLGQIFLAAGLLVLLFVAYELWGTTFWTNRAQSRLRDEFRQKVAAPAPASPPAPGATTPSTTLPPPDAALAPPEGGALARVLIPSIGVDAIVVEGVDPGDLRAGPGHYPGSPLPGQDGNFVLSGHRTTYGAPFHNLDKLLPGAEVIVQSPAGEFVYQVQWVRVVAPEAVEVVRSTAGVKEITLTTCHPKFSASQRLVVRGQQTVGPRPLSISG